MSHGQAIRELSNAGIPVIFRGDSHLLDGRGPWWRWVIKKSILSKVYRWPKGFAYVGQANRDYYRAFGVPEEKLFPVPHTIEVGRFAEPNDELEGKALAWRRELGIPDDHFVFLYAAKLEPRKRPMELLEAFLRADLPKTTLLFVGSGELDEALRARANTGHGLTRIGTDKSDRHAPTEPGEKLVPDDLGTREWSSDEKAADLNGHSRAERDRQLEELSEAVKLTRINTDLFSGGDCLGAVSPSLGSVGRFFGEAVGTETLKHGNTEPPVAEDPAHRVVFVPFQNQSQMPLVYRLGDALVLPSGFWETWGLAVNEAQACGRPSLVSDCVGCARDIIRERESGMIFRTDDWEDCLRAMKQMTEIDWRSKRDVIRATAWEFDTARGVDALLRGIRHTVGGKRQGGRRAETNCKTVN